MIAQGAVDADFVVFFSPSFQKDFCFSQRVEDFAVQELVSKFVVKALDVTLLPRRPRLDVVTLDSSPFEPVLDSVSNELGAVVTPDKTRRSMLVDKFFKDFDDIFCPITLARTQAVTFASMLIDHAEHSKACSPVSLVMHEVPTPNMITMILSLIHI